MRSQPLARIISAAAALTLLTSSAVSAQVDTRFPEARGQTLVSTVVTSELDDATSNTLVVETARSYHQAMEGEDKSPSVIRKNAKKQKPRGGFLAVSYDDTELLTDSIVGISQRYEPDVMVISGGDGQANVGIARTVADETILIDLGQPRPCVTETGQADGSGECAGSAGSVPSNYTAVEFAVEDGAYLAGVLAAKASRGGRLGVISGYEGCRECQRYVEGFVNGARSVNRDIDVVVDYLADDEISAFSDPETARTFTEIFLDVYQPAVLMPVGRATSVAMIEAVCEAGALAVGTGREIRETRPDLDCVMASVIKDLPRAIKEAMYAFSYGETVDVMTYDVADGGVTISEDWAERVAWYPVDTEEIYLEALDDITSGKRKACPDGCGGSLPDIERSEETS